MRRLEVILRFPILGLNLRNEDGFDKFIDEEA
jgi:hypothetical protein